MISRPGQNGVANEIKNAYIPITDDLNTITEEPDIIHGNHLHETLTACLRFPNTPAIWVCHSWDGPHDKAPKFPSIKKFLAVDESCLERLLNEESIRKSQSGLLLNCVDLDRFKARSPLPEKPKSALVLSHYAAHTEWFRAVQEACEKVGIELDAFGAGLENVSAEPEQLMKRYDIVFAVDRTALEAVSVGTCVILCGLPGLGPIVTSKNCEALRKQNFGRKWLSQQVTTERILDRLAQYDPVDAQNASAITRAQADSSTYFDNLEDLYENVLDEVHDEISDNTHLHYLECASDYMSSLSAAVRTYIWGNDEHLQMKIQRDGLIETAERRRLRLERLEHERHQAVEEKDRLKKTTAELTLKLQEQENITAALANELSTVTATLSNVERELKLLQNSKTIVLKNRLFKFFRP
jgi:hypothetical protein